MPAGGLDCPPARLPFFRAGECRKRFRSRQSGNERADQRRLYELASFHLTSMSIDAPEAARSPYGMRRAPLRYRQ